MDVIVGIALQRLISAVLSKTKPIMGSYLLHQSLFSSLFTTVAIILLWFISRSCLASAANRGGLLMKNNDTDELSLLAFKKEVTFDPTHVLDSWNVSVHFCSWPGVTCGRRHQRATALKLPSCGLEGTLTPHLGNLSFLRNLSLANNSFQGEIPHQLGGLFRLKRLFLNNNTFHGRIPTSLSNCSNLIALDLSYNVLEGGIPDELGSLTRLGLLQLGFNRRLGGDIPPSLGNLSSLTILSLSECVLHGSIPHQLGRLSKVGFLSLHMNELRGEIPSSLFSNMSQLYFFQAGGNKLTGNFPSYIDETCPGLEGFAIFDNQISGYLPHSFWNLTNLWYVDVVNNNLVGSIPEKIGKLARLKILRISGNQLGGSSSKNDLQFITSLTNCTNLEELQTRGNNFYGLVPSSIVNLSTNLEYLAMGESPIYGTIHPDIRKLINLRKLYLYGSDLTGPIPPSIGEIPNLQVLNLGLNKLTGTIPVTIGNLSKLVGVGLNVNQLKGYIPPSVGNCTNLELLFLSTNGLSGPIPPTLAGCQRAMILFLDENSLTGTIPSDFLISSPSILQLELSQNMLSGSLPQEVGHLRNINMLDVSSNRLSGVIPDSLGRCLTLQFLYLDNNAFEGNISTTFDDLKALQEIDFSRNKLIGHIPSYLSKLQLDYLNLSYNNLEGKVPIEGVFKNMSAISLQGNTKLCGGIFQLHLPPCKEQKGNEGHKKVKLILLLAVLAGSIVIVLVLCSFFIFRKRAKKKAITLEESLEEQLHMRMVSYGDILNATNNFSGSNLIGMGSFGKVYRGVLEADQSVVAVKVFDLAKFGASKSFMAECEALQNIRHRNLVKILTCCSGYDYREREFKALVYEFMENGTLESWLYPETEQSSGAQSRHLSLKSRLEIAIDVAHALDYLHNHSPTPIVHCDLKPSNILLDQEMVAHVSDFGLAKLLLTTDTDSISQLISTGQLKGTIGYIPPEYGSSSYVTTRGDTYSYGVILLEILIAKRPMHEMFKEDLTISSYVKRAFPDHVLEIVDQQMFPLGLEGSEVRKIKDCMISMIQVGIECSSEIPSDRMDIGTAKTKLEFVRKMLPRGDGI